jgi:deoxyribonuclease-4
MILGAHIGISGGLAQVPAQARAVGADAVQIFSKNQQQWSASPLDPAEVEGFRSAMKRERIRSSAVHTSYLINLGSPQPTLQERSRAAFQEEIQRAETLGIPLLIFHPGAHTGSGEAAGLAAIASGVRHALEEDAGGPVRILLENAAGAGSTLGSTFEQLAHLLDSIDEPKRTGVCLDTCHLFAAGYDFRTDQTYRETLAKLDATVGTDRVFAFHLNDAQEELGSHRDRHANIGNGNIGLPGFRRLVNDRRFSKVPGFLETPLRGDKSDPYVAYREDLANLRSLVARRPVRRG